MVVVLLSYTEPRYAGVGVARFPGVHSLSYTSSGPQRVVVKLLLMLVKLLLMLLLLLVLLAGDVTNAVAVVKLVLR